MHRTYREQRKIIGFSFIAFLYTKSNSHTSGRRLQTFTKISVFRTELQRNLMVPILYYNFAVVLFYPAATFPQQIPPKLTVSTLSQGTLQDK